MDLGKHAVFIWSSYAATGLVLAALIAWLMVTGRRYQRELSELEARGVRRRSRAGEDTRSGDETGSKTTGGKR